MLDGEWYIRPAFQSQIDAAYLHQARGQYILEDFDERPWYLVEMLVTVCIEGRYTYMCMYLSGEGNEQRIFPQSWWVLVSIGRENQLISHNVKSSLVVLISSWGLNIVRVMLKSIEPIGQFQPHVSWLARRAHNTPELSCVLSHLRTAISLHHLSIIACYYLWVSSSVCYESNSISLWTALIKYVSIMTRCLYC